MQRIARAMLIPALFGAAPFAHAQAVPPAAALPPPAPDIYDPQPGPFIVVLDEAGRLDPDQHGVIANAIDVWRGGTLGAFLLCSRSKRGAPVWRDSWEGLLAVRRELRARGAKQVVIHGWHNCPHPAPSSRLEHTNTVEIMGVIAPE